MSLAHIFRRHIANQGENILLQTTHNLLAAVLALGKHQTCPPLVKLPDGHTGSLLLQLNKLGLLLKLGLHLLGFLLNRGVFAFFQDAAGLVAVFPNFLQTCFRPSTTRQRFLFPIKPITPNKKDR